MAPYYNVVKYAAQNEIAALSNVKSIIIKHMSLIIIDGGILEHSLEKRQIGCSS